MCRALLALGIKAIDLGALLASCPALLACPPDVLQEQVHTTPYFPATVSAIRDL